MRIVEEEEDSLILDELNTTDEGSPSSEILVNRSTSPFGISLAPSPASTSLVSALGAENPTSVRFG